MEAEFVPERGHCFDPDRPYQNSRILLRSKKRYILADRQLSADRGCPSGYDCGSHFNGSLPEDAPTNTISKLVVSAGYANTSWKQNTQAYVLGEDAGWHKVLQHRGLQEALSTFGTKEVPVATPTPPASLPLHPSNGQLLVTAAATQPAGTPTPTPAPPCSLVEFTDEEIDPHMVAAHKDSLSPSAQGGFGTVFEADLPGLGKVVVKLFRHMLDPNPVNQQCGRQAISRGLSILQQMRHPNIPVLRGLVRCKVTGDVIGLLLDRFPYTLDSIGTACGFNKLVSTPLEIKIRILADAVSALMHLHERGFVHRDIKPLNILADNTHVGYLNDFDCVIQAGECQVHAEVCRKLAATRLGQGGSMETLLENLDGVGLAGTRYFRPPEGQVGATAAHLYTFDAYSVGASVMFIIEGGLTTLKELDKAHSVPAVIQLQGKGGARLSGPPTQLGAEQLCSRLVEAGMRFHYPAGSTPDPRQIELLKGLSKLAVSATQRNPEHRLAAYRSADSSKGGGLIMRCMYDELNRLLGP